MSHGQPYQALVLRRRAKVQRRHAHPRARAVDEALQHMRYSAVNSSPCELNIFNCLPSLISCAECIAELQRINSASDQQPLVKVRRRRDDGDGTGRHVERRGVVPQRGGDARGTHASRRQNCSTLADPRLDLCAEQFDAAYALEHPELAVLPCPDVRPLDNVAACHARMFPKQPARPALPPDQHVQDAPKRPRIAEPAVPTAPAAAPEAAQHDDPAPKSACCLPPFAAHNHVDCRVKAEDGAGHHACRPFGTVRYRACSAQQGWRARWRCCCRPIGGACGSASPSAPQPCVHSDARLALLIHTQGVRGHCTGHVVAFDSHLNMVWRSPHSRRSRAQVLLDVLETYTQTELVSKVRPALRSARSQ